MKITKRQLRRIIKEEKRTILKEITPGAAGIAAMGGGTPADRGAAAVMQDDRDALTATHDWRDGIEQFIYETLGEDDMKAEGRYIVKALEMIRQDIQDEMRGPVR